jgi:hypothetical protein
MIRDTQCSDRPSWRHLVHRLLGKHDPHASEGQRDAETSRGGVAPALNDQGAAAPGIANAHRQGATRQFDDAVRGLRRQGHGLNQENPNAIASKRKICASRGPLSSAVRPRDPAIVRVMWG